MCIYIYRERETLSLESPDHQFYNHMLTHESSALHAKNALGQYTNLSGCFAVVAADFSNLHFLFELAV